jgi:hypothetical protein
MAANSLYQHIEASDAKAHDDLLLETQKALLNKVAGSTSAPGARNFAEAYALISGHISATNSTEVKNG